MRARGHKVRKQAGRHDEAEGSAADEATRPDRRLHCRGCGHRITAVAERIEVTGQHAHTCVNPAGIVFRVGCFGRASGMAKRGPLVREHSWFAGYAWQIGVCGRCQAHLGWAFRGEAMPPFWGLIVDRLEERDA